MDYIKKEIPTDILKKGIVSLVIGAIIFVLGFVIDAERAFLDYLWMFMFMLSIGVGSLALVAMEYLVGATWSTPFRRISEFLAGIIPLSVILVIPLFFGMHSMYHWTHEETVVIDPVLSSKSSYLNLQFFTIRVAICLIIWLTFYYIFTKNSEKQDENGDVSYTKSSNRFAVVFAPLFIVSISVAAIDWMMSLEPHWFSTIYGVYYFAGTMVACYSITLLIAIHLKDGGYLSPRLNNQHYYSLGTLMFGFNVFWAYIAFSQYLLIWYADLPEETFWMIKRWGGAWTIISLTLLFAHFIIPFLVLVSRGSKTNPSKLKFMAVWMLFAHALDLYWLIMPTHPSEGFPLSWIDIGMPLVTFGLIVIVFRFRASKRNMIAIRDPKLEAGFDFHL